MKTAMYLTLRNIPRHLPCPVQPLQTRPLLIHAHWRPQSVELFATLATLVGHERAPAQLVSRQYVQLFSGSWPHSPE